MKYWLFQLNQCFIKLLQKIFVGCSSGGIGGVGSGGGGSGTNMYRF